MAGRGQGISGALAGVGDGQLGTGIGVGVTLRWVAAVGQGVLGGGVAVTRRGGEWGRLRKCGGMQGGGTWGQGGDVWGWGSRAPGNTPGAEKPRSEQILQPSTARILRGSETLREGAEKPQGGSFPPSSPHLFP